jgi:prepilin-type N-terminal cleavage/methylation domain-containing protein
MMNPPSNPESGIPRLRSGQVRNPESPPGNAGFTLIEILLAVVISAVIATAIFGTLAAGRDVSRRGALQAELDQIARQSLERLAADLRLAVLPSEIYDSGFTGEQDGEDADARDRLDFVTASGLPDPYRMGPVETEDADRPRRIDLARVLYFIDDDETTPERGLVRAEQIYLNTPTVQQDEDLERIEIAPEAVALRLRYCLGETWFDTWDSRQANALPQAVEVTLTVRVERNDAIHERKLMTIVRCLLAPPATQLDASTDPGS